MINLSILTVIACMSMAVFMIIFNEDTLNQSMLMYLKTPANHPKNLRFETIIEENETITNSNDEILQCILPKYDSWDKEILYVSFITCFFTLVSVVGTPVR